MENNKDKRINQGGGGDTNQSRGPGRINIKDA